MNQEQLMGQLRTWLAASIAAFAATHIPPDFLTVLPPGWESVIATFLSGLPFAMWSFWAKRPAAVSAQAVTQLKKEGHPTLAKEVAQVQAAKA